MYIFSSNTWPLNGSVLCDSMERRKEGNVLFNDALNTFYLQLYGIGYTDSERGNPLLPHGLLFPISSKGSFYASFHRQDSTYHGLVIPSVGHWLEREIAQWVHHEGLICRPITPCIMLLPWNDSMHLST